MASDPWSNSRLSTSSRRYQSRSGADLYFGGHEENEGDDDSRVEFLCPFCDEDFDIVGLCCHIDEEHPVEAQNGVCPVCTKKVDMDIVGHITMQHGNFFKVQRKRRLRKGNSTFSLLTKELREGTLKSLLGGSSGLVSSSNAEPDPLLLSFMSSPPVVDDSKPVQPHSTIEGSLVKESSGNDFSERKVQLPILSQKDQEEKARKCEFFQGLLLSTILDDDL